MSDRRELLRRQRVLSEFGDFVLDHEDLDEILNEGCRLIAEALDTDLAKVIEIETASDTGFVRAGIGWRQGIVGHERISLTERSSEAYAIATGEPLITNDVEHERRFEFPRFLRDHGVVALINVPILLPGRRPWGVLQVDACRARAFDQNDIEFLKTYAMALGPVVDRLRVAEERKQVRAELAEREERLEAELAAGRTLQKISTELISEHQPEALYTQILDAAMALMNADAAGLQILEPDGRTLRLLASRNFHPDAEAFWKWVDTESGSACGRALATRERVIVPDAEACAAMADTGHLLAYRQSGMRSAQSTLLFARDGRPVGMLSTLWRQPHQPQAADFDLFDVLARQAADLIERTRSETALRESQSSLEAELGWTTLLHDLAARLVSEESLSAVYAEILSVAITLMDADAGTVQIYDAATRSLVLLATSGFDSRMTDHFHRVDATSNTACGRALKAGTRAFIDFDQDATDDACRRHLEAGYRSAQATPLISRDGMSIGMLNTHWRTAGHRPSADQLRFLDLLARQAADLIDQRQDEAALRESEQRMTRLLTLLPVAVYAVDVEGRLTFFNQRAVECWGRTPVLNDDEDRWCGSLRMWRLDGEPLRHEDCPMVPAVREGRAARNLEVVIERPDGDLIVALVNIDPLHDANGTIVGALNAFEDITERKRAEAALRQSDEQQQFMLSISDALGALGTPGEIATMATMRLCEQLQADRVVYGLIDGSAMRLTHEYTRGVPSILGEHALTAFGFDFMAAYRPGAILTVDDIERRADLSEPARAELRRRQIAAFADAILFEEGQAVTLLAVQSASPRHWSSSEEGLIRAVGDRMKSAIKRVSAEAALRQSEERLRQFGEASQDVLWIRDVRTLQWVYLTPAFESIYGLGRDEALSGNNYRSWLDLILPEEREHANQSIASVREGRHVTFDYRIRRPSDGGIRWIRNTDFPITDETGDVVLIGGIGHDLTELREAEMRLQTLMEGIPQLVWRAIDEGHWTWASPQWVDYTGQNQDQSRGWGWLDALHPQDRAIARSAWEHAAETGGFEVEYRICHVDRHEFRWFQTRATPVRDETGAIIEWLGTSTDIHELRELGERQQVLVAELQHRTRNLMGVIRSMADKTAKASVDFDDFRTRYRDRLDAMARVQGLLSRLNEHDRVTFDELIDSEIAAMAGPGNVTLEGPPGVRLRSSTVQTLAMALHELATNAVKYGALSQAEGRLDIHWSAESRGEGGKPWLHIDWRESGVKMPPAGSAPRGSGQGRELIEKALPYQLRARTSYAMGPDGVHCTISIPISETTHGVETADG